MGSKKGFTLAEVLITLGIIGVVAAITLPMIIAKYKGLLQNIRIRFWLVKQSVHIQLFLMQC